MPLPLTLGPSRALLAVPPAADPLAALRVGLVSSWRLQEASGVAVDSVGSNTLTANNSPSTAAGPNGWQARSLAAGANQSFSRADNASLSTGDLDFTWAAWAYLASGGTARTIVSKGPSAASSTNEYFLRYSIIVSRFRWSVGNGTTNGQVDANTLGAPSTGQWYFLVAWHDSVADTVNIQANNGGVDSTSYSSGGYDNTTLLSLGASDNADSTFWDGRLALVAFWKRVLTAAERTQLFNSGNGVVL